MCIRDRFVNGHISRIGLSYIYHLILLEMINKSHDTTFSGIKNFSRLLVSLGIDLNSEILYHRIAAKIFRFTCNVSSTHAIKMNPFEMNKKE